jgi:ketosteroid isomerase-like protein
MPPHRRLATFVQGLGSLQKPSMERDDALRLLARLHERQGAFYAGGPDAPLREILAADVTWHVPGENAIAGTYAGVGEVLAYMARRRDIARGTFRMRPGDVLTGDGDHVAVLTDGEAEIDGRRWTWSTVGLYRFRDDGLLAAGWLLPLDQAAFDRVWAAR